MADDLRIMSYNIRYGGRGRESRLAATIRACEPHLVVLQEATQPDVVRRVASDSGMTSWDAKTGHSVAFMSRVPTQDATWHHPAGSRRAFLELTLPTVALRVYAVHLSAVHASWTERRRVRELRAVLERTTREGTAAHVVLGDFNTLAPGEQLDISKLPRRLRPLVWLSGGSIRWQTIQLMLEAGYADAFRVLHPGDDGFTFPAWSPHVRLDYAFVPASFAGRLLGCRVATGAGPEEAASDHLPLVTELSVVSTDPVG